MTKLKSWTKRIMSRSTQLFTPMACALTPWRTQTGAPTSPWPGSRCIGGSTGGSRRKGTCYTCATTGNTRWPQPLIIISATTLKCGFFAQRTCQDILLLWLPCPLPWQIALICGCYAQILYHILVKCGYIALNIICGYNTLKTEVICGYIAQILYHIWSDKWLHRPIKWFDLWLHRPICIFHPYSICRYVLRWTLWLLRPPPYICHVFDFYYLLKCAHIM